MGDRTVEREAYILKLAWKEAMSGEEKPRGRELRSGELGIRLQGQEGEKNIPCS